MVRFLVSGRTVPAGKAKKPLGARSPRGIVFPVSGDESRAPKGSFLYCHTMPRLTKQISEKYFRSQRQVTPPSISVAAYSHSSLPYPAGAAARCACAPWSCCCGRRPRCPGGARCRGRVLGQWRLSPGGWFLWLLAGVGWSRQSLLEVDEVLGVAAPGAGHLHALNL